MKDSYTRLIKLGLSRSNIKPVIMTKPYNAKDRTLADYIKDTLTYNHSDEIRVLDEYGNETKRTIGWYKINKDSENYVNRSDIE